MVNDKEKKKMLAQLMFKKVNTLKLSMSGLAKGLLRSPIKEGSFRNLPLPKEPTNKSPKTTKKHSIKKTKKVRKKNKVKTKKKKHVGKKKITKIVTKLQAITSKIIDKVVRPVSSIAQAYPRNIDTGQIELEMDEMLMTKSTRISLEYFILYATLFLMLSSILDLYFFYRVHQLIAPFDCILEPVNASTSTNYLYAYGTLVLAYPVIALGRVRLYAGVIDSENEELNMGRAGGNLLKLSITTMIALVVLIGFVFRFSAILANLGGATEFKSILYRIETNLRCLDQLSLLQKRYRCCGVNGHQEFRGNHSSRQNKTKISEMLIETLLTSINDKNFEMQVIPPSCCDPHFLGFCAFIIYSNQNSYKNMIELQSKKNNTTIEEKPWFYQQGCLPAVKTQVRNIGTSVECWVLIKLALEFFLFQIQRIVTVSYTSAHELGHSPSITRVPYFLMFMFGLAWLLVYYYGCRFFSLWSVVAGK